MSEQIETEFFGRVRYFRQQVDITYRSFQFIQDGVVKIQLQGRADCRLMLPP